MISSISSFDSFEIISNPKMFFSIAASVADIAAVNSNGINTLLANSLSTLNLKWKKRKQHTYFVPLKLNQTVKKKLKKSKDYVSINRWNLKNKTKQKKKTN